MKLNEKILYHRRAAKLSQEELAAMVGVSRQAVSKWELGDATPEVDKLLALARAFGVTTDELLDGGEPSRDREDAEAPREEPPGRTAPNAPQEGNFEKTAGLIGRLIQTYGWLAGVRIALSGLGFILVGTLARWGFGVMFGEMAMDLQFPVDVSPEMRRQILAELGHASVPSPVDGIEGFFLGFATVILVIGIITMIAGVVLAAYLYQKGNRQP